jgi:hypothetical protein
MTTWYSGWGWCSVMINLPAMVLLWAAVVAAVVLAVRSAVRRPSDPPTQPSTGRPRPNGMAAVRIGPSGTDTDEFYRRLM